MVGEILIFNLGDMFGVDGIIIQGSEVKVDETSLTGESDEIKKIPLDELKQMRESHQEEDKHEGANPFLISGTKVVDGSGIMLVLAVGENTC